MSRNTPEIFHSSTYSQSMNPNQLAHLVQPGSVASPFPPAPPADSSSSQNLQSAHAFQPFLREQQQERQGNQFGVNVNYSSQTQHSVHSSSFSAAHETATLSPLTSHHQAAPEASALDIRIGSNTSDMYSKMREVQLNHLPKYQPNSPYIKYRRYLVDWLAETSEELRFKYATVHVAASFLDRVLIQANHAASGRCTIPKHLWQLVAMVCLRIAGKFEEREEDVTGDSNGMLVLANRKRMSAVEAFTRHLGDAAMMVTSAQIKEWEIFVLENLGWNLSTVTPVHCLEFYEGRGVVYVDDSWNGRALIEKIPRYIKKYNDFFANLCLQDYFYAQFSPSHLAASILYASRYALSLSPVWRPELETLTGHSEQEVFEVFTHIWKYYSDTFPTHARKSASPKGIEEVDAI